MNKTRAFIHTVCMLVIFKAALAYGDNTKEPYRNISATEAHALLHSPSKPIILDIRTPGEFSAGHIKEAININFRANNFRQQLDALDKNTSYLLHCRSGGRSTAALEHFRALGFSKVLHLNKGMLEWEAAGLPIEKN
jgi:rhodanese-related sulfurtransferase